MVVTGVSGSGKSSLAFDTLYAEGQRRYVESLSSYARQFLGRMSKPDVERIENIPPAIAIQQRVTSRNPRSTVGTTTEIYDYLKLLYARIGKTYAPKSGKEVKRHSVRDVVAAMEEYPAGSRLYLVAPGNEQDVDRWKSEGFSRTWTDPEGRLYLLVDRIVVDHERTTSNRMADSAQTAFYEGNGQCSLIAIDEVESHKDYRQDFSTRFEADGIRFIEPTEHLFDFNNPLGACPTCKGFGNILGADPDLVIPNQAMTIYEGAIACWRGEKLSVWNHELCANADKFGFPIHTPYYQLTDEQKRLLWTGNEYFHGLTEFFQDLEQKQHGKLQYAVLLARYRGKTICPECAGSKLRAEAGYVKVGGASILELCEMPIEKLAGWFEQLALTQQEQQTAKQILHEITSRLQFMQDVGLGYLTLNRQSNTLSGGESQRISLAKSLGSSLVGSLYVLDEPSIGLHARDTERLIHVLRQLRDLGNTIVVVEHDEEIIAAADYLIEIGPAAGRHGGELVFAGKPEDKPKTPQEAPRVPIRRPWKDYLEVKNACQNNLKNLTVHFPLHVMTAVTGVSGSGKSTLIKQLRGIEFVDQNPLSKSSRSNPVTYLKAYDEIRRLYAEQQLSKQMGFTPAHFSFNTPGGRCETCQGEGTITVEMQFMADLTIPCEQCHGRRFKQDVLDVEYRGKNIYDVLCMTVNQAIEFFGEEPAGRKIVERLKPLQDVGIGYVQLGQSSSTLSGGESQRVKLAFYLSSSNSSHTVFVFDEPTTGLSHSDIEVLLKALNALVAQGHTVICIEHNPQIIMASDHVIDLGPEGGEKGGQIVYEGTPEGLMECEQSYTGHYLKARQVC